MPLVSAFPLAAAGYLIATGATRAEAVTVLDRIANRAVPLTLEDTLDTLDDALAALRQEQRHAAP